MMHYKDYLGSIEFDEEERLFYGKLEFIRALVSYEAKDADSLVTVFHEAVDAYLAQCEAHGVKPEKPFKGSFNVQVGRQLHRDAALAAARAGLSLNQFVADAVREALQRQR